MPTSINDTLKLIDGCLFATYGCLLPVGEVSVTIISAMERFWLGSKTKATRTAITADTTSPLTRALCEFSYLNRYDNIENFLDIAIYCLRQFRVMNHHRTQSLHLLLGGIHT